MNTKQKFYSYIEELCAYAIADCEVNDKKADEFWGWFKLKMEEEYKRGREDEAIECQKDMERVVEETKREVVEEKEKTDLEKLATYLRGLIPYHKMAHNKQVPVQECPDCLSLVGAKLDYNPSKEEGRRANMMYLIKDDGINTYKVEITGEGGGSVSNKLKADEVLRLIKQALLGKKTPKE